MEATFVDYYTMICVSPPVEVDGTRQLELALDDYHFTERERPWTYYDPEDLKISAVDPIGGPARGGTLIQVLGRGFLKMGGVITHGSAYSDAEVSGLYAADTTNPKREITAGTYCKFSINTTRDATRDRGIGAFEKGPTGGCSASSAGIRARRW